MTSNHADGTFAVEDCYPLKTQALAYPEPSNEPKKICEEYKIEYGSVIIFLNEI